MERKQECHISKLNDDCLINVIRHLSIKDRISSERGIYFFIFLKKQELISTLLTCETKICKITSYHLLKKIAYHIRIKTIHSSRAAAILSVDIFSRG